MSSPWVCVSTDSTCPIVPVVTLSQSPATKGLSQAASIVLPHGLCGMRSLFVCCVPRASSLTSLSLSSLICKLGILMGGSCFNEDETVNVNSNHDLFSFYSILRVHYWVSLGYENTPCSITHFKKYCGTDMWVVQCAVFDLVCILSLTNFIVKIYYNGVLTVSKLYFSPVFFTLFKLVKPHSGM
jgi:hypothetical protein